MRSVLVWLMVLAGDIFVSLTPGFAAQSQAEPCRPAELYATDNTAVITAPGAPTLQDGLTLFELQADLTIVAHGAVVTGSTLLDGVYWSGELARTTYERSREFHLCSPDEPTLHTVAEALRLQFHQEAVLTFDYLPPKAPAANAVAITVPDVDTDRFRAAFAADPAAHSRLQGGSVGAADHTLNLVAAAADIDAARRLVSEAGGSWSAAEIAYGRREFV